MTGSGDSVNVGDLAWAYRAGSTWPDTIGIVEEVIQNEPWDEPHVRVQGFNSLRDLMDLSSAGRPQPYNGMVIVKWLSGNPIESDEHEEWPVEELASNGLRRAVKATDPWGQKHWLVLPSQYVRQVTYGFEHTGCWINVVGQGLSR
jgi:hypothetical protein